MSQPTVISLLNQLLAVVDKSFPQYLQYARPYVPPGREAVMETIASIAADQDVLADRIGQMLNDLEAPVRSGEFPMEYTDLHDLRIDFLILSAIDYKEQDIAAIGSLVDQLQFAPAARALAEEALGMAKGHLESLRESVAEGAAAS